MSRMGVVTVTHNSVPVLAEFLESICKQTHSSYVLYIIDSGSTDGTQDRLRAMSDVSRTSGDAPGKHRIRRRDKSGHQMALEEGCESVMLLNNDTAFGPELFQQLSDGLDRYNCDMTTPKMLYYNAPEKIWASGRPPE